MISDEDSGGIERDEGPTVICEQYDGCQRAAKYRVTNLGGNAELDALDHLDVCASCADEWRELNHEAIRELSAVERRRATGE